MDIFIEVNTNKQNPSKLDAVERICGDLLLDIIIPQFFILRIKILQKVLNGKENFFLSLLLLNFNSFLYCQNSSEIDIRINIDNPNEYLPDYLENIYLGIPFKDFINIKDTLFLEKLISNSSEWVAYKENVLDYYIDHIIYKFDAVPDSINNSLPLFQINIFYTEQEELNNFLNEKFGSPLVEIEGISSQWILKTNKNFVLIVKQINNEVKLIATIAGAEWDPNE